MLTLMRAAGLEYLSIHKSNNRDICLKKKTQFIPIIHFHNNRCEFKMQAYLTTITKFHLNQNLNDISI